MRWRFDKSDVLAIIILVIGGPLYLRESDVYAKINVSGQIAGHDYVDLGLPSGTKWATCNVGAASPIAYGNYYAYGEVTTKESYSEENYRFFELKCKWPHQWGQDMYYYTYTDFNWNDTTDAATANWGTEWCIPTSDEWKELLDGCKWRYVENFNGSGVAGMVGKSKQNGHVIFFPAAGKYGRKLDNVGSLGQYRISRAKKSYYKKCPSSLFLESGRVNITEEESSLYEGLSVRAVSPLE